jgi:hypothetical protein
MYFAVSSDDQHSSPVTLVDDFVDFQAHLGVQPYPFDFLSDRGEPLEAVPTGVEGEIDRNDVGLIESSVAKAPQTIPLESCGTLGRVQFVDQHGAHLSHCDAPGSDRFCPATLLKIGFVVCRHATLLSPVHRRAALVIPSL